MNMITSNENTWDLTTKKSVTDSTGSIEGFEKSLRKLSCKYPIKHENLFRAIDFCKEHSDSCKGIYDRHCNGTNISTCVDTNPIPNSTEHGCLYTKKGKVQPGIYIYIFIIIYNTLY